MGAHSPGAAEIQTTQVSDLAYMAAGELSLYFNMKLPDI